MSPIPVSDTELSTAFRRREGGLEGLPAPGMIFSASSTWVPRQLVVIGEYAATVNLMND